MDVYIVGQPTEREFCSMKTKEVPPKVAKDEVYPESHPVSMKRRNVPVKDICRHHGVTAVGEVIHLMPLTNADLVACLTLGPPVDKKAWAIVVEKGLIGKLRRKIKLAVPLVHDKVLSEEICAGLRPAKKKQVKAA